MMVIEISIQ